MLTDHDIAQLALTHPYVDSRAGHADISMSAYYAQLADSELAEVKHRVNPLGRMIAGARMPDSHEDA